MDEMEEEDADASSPKMNDVDGETDLDPDAAESFFSMVALKTKLPGKGGDTRQKKTRLEYEMRALCTMHTIG